jgi:AcrR family transcriptional regulator
MPSSTKASNQPKAVSQPKAGKQPKADKQPKARKPRLSAERVLDGAMELADEIGVEGLTIRRLADHLDTKPMTIYHHIPNKEAIVDGMVDRVFTEIDRPPADLHWKEAMRHRCSSARQVLARHRWAAPLMESRTNPGPATLAHHDAVLGCLRGGGLTLAMAGHAYAVLDAFVYGFALQEASLPATGGEEMAELAEHIMEPLPDDLYPHMTEFTTEYVLKPGYDFRAEFEFGLNLILDGLEAAASKPD